MERTVALRDQLKAGLVAGVAAGILIDLFLFAMQLAAGTPPEKLAANFVFIAAVLLGPGAYANPVAVPLGIVLHFCVAIGWALGYVYLVRSQPQLLARPWISGAAFGLVVYVFMEIVLITAGLYHRVAPGLFFTQLVAHVVFYGIPVAVVASRMLRTVVAHPATSSG
ncbi:MAG: hypothetical protein M3N49_11640 [Candidatus Eremiobacteraeota bacterium]|nr:hypothetical protein [Candidatus Eremiobacteraeota bacterium]